jgi:hypothetical protein
MNTILKINNNPLCKHHYSNFDFVLSEHQKKKLTNRLIISTPFFTKSTISYGLIVYSKNTKKWVLVQRKHSVEFLLFIKGLYRISYLPILINCITLNELDIIHKCINDPEYFKYIYNDILQLDITSFDYALIRITENSEILTKLLNSIKINDNILSWNWPKGRLYFKQSPGLFGNSIGIAKQSPVLFGNQVEIDKQSFGLFGNSTGIAKQSAEFTIEDTSSNVETPLECAKREFLEEVEITLPPPLYITENYITNIIRTINGRNIESRYWIYIINDEIPISPPDNNPEVISRDWFDTDTAQKLLNNDEFFDDIKNHININYEILF